MPRLVPRWLHPKEGKTPPEAQIFPPSRRTKTITIIAVSASTEKCARLQEIAEKHGWEFVSASDWTDGFRTIEERGTGLVLVDQGIFGPRWQENVARLLNPRHRCCVILLKSHTEPDRQSLEFLREGGYEVLQPPLEELEVVKAVRLAWAFWSACICRPRP